MRESSPDTPSFASWPINKLLSALSTLDAQLIEWLRTERSATPSTTNYFAEVEVLLTLVLELGDFLKMEDRRL